MSPYVIPGIVRSKPIEAQHIIEAIEAVTYYDLEALKKINREHKLVFARQLLFYFMRKHTDITWKRLAKMIEQDHTTAIHGERKIIGFIKIKDPCTLKAVRQIDDLLR